MAVEAFCFPEVELLSRSPDWTLLLTETLHHDFPNAPSPPPVFYLQLSSYSNQPCRIFSLECKKPNLHKQPVSTFLTRTSRSNARIRGTSSRVGGPSRSPTTTDGPSTSHNIQLPTTSVPRVSLPGSSSLSDSISMMPQTLEYPRPLPLWLNPAHAKHIVKGNFLTLSVRPKTVEQGEWVAHQGNTPSSRL